MYTWLLRCTWHPSFAERTLLHVTLYLWCYDDIHGAMMMFMLLLWRLWCNYDIYRVMLCYLWWDYDTCDELLCLWCNRDVYDVVTVFMMLVICFMTSLWCLWGHHAMFCVAVTYGHIYYCNVCRFAFAPFGRAILFLLREIRFSTNYACCSYMFCCCALSNKLVYNSRTLYRELIFLKHYMVYNFFCFNEALCVVPLGAFVPCLLEPRQGRSKFWWEIQCQQHPLLYRALPVHASLTAHNEKKHEKLWKICDDDRSCHWWLGFVILLRTLRLTCDGCPWTNGMLAGALVCVCSACSWRTMCASLLPTHGDWHEPWVCV